MQKFFQQVYLY